MDIKDIKIYSTSICSACVALTHWLDKQNITYKKLITDEDPAIMEEFMQINDGMIGVPFTVITDKDGKQTKLSGFDIQAFKTALKLA